MDVEHRPDAGAGRLALSVPYGIIIGMSDPLTARTREELIDAMASGATPKWLMFWGHRPEADGSAGKGALSQWWPCSFTVDSVEYPSAEHWMMAQKARMFEDDESLRAILAARSPAEAKALGRLLGAGDPLAQDPRRWRGRNELGFALMEARARLAA